MWKDLITDYDEEKLEPAMEYVLPLFGNNRENLDKVINLAVVFSCQPVKRPIPRDGKEEIRTTESLVNFLRNLYLSMKK